MAADDDDDDDDDIFRCHFCPVLFSFKNFVPVTVKIGLGLG